MQSDQLLKDGQQLVDQGRQLIATHLHVRGQLLSLVLVLQHDCSRHQAPPDPTGLHQRDYQRAALVGIRNAGRRLLTEARRESPTLQALCAEAAGADPEAVQVWNDQLQAFGQALQQEAETQLLQDGFSLE